MGEKYQSKLFNPTKITFLAEQKHQEAFKEVCDRYQWNESAVLRRILLHFLQEHNVDLNELDEQLASDDFEDT